MYYFIVVAVLAKVALMVIIVGLWHWCSVNFFPSSSQASNSDNQIKIIDDEYFVEIDSKMTKDDYIYFIAYVTSEEIEIKKLYPEQTAQASFLRRSQGFIYYYDLKNGLFRIKI